MDDAATPVGVEVKIVPDGYARGGSALRAVLDISPSSSGKIVLSDWPHEVNRLLQNLQVTLADISNGQNPDPATSTPLDKDKVRVLHDKNNVDQANTLWKTLMAPLRATTAGAVSALFEKLAKHVTVHKSLHQAFSAARQCAEQPWSTLRDAINNSADAQRMRFFTETAKGDPKTEPLRISDVPSTDLARIFRHLGAVRYLHFIAGPSPGTIRALGPHTEMWSGLTDLWLGAPMDSANKTETAETLILDKLGQRGLKSAIAVSENERKSNAVAVFTRKPPPPAPEPRLSANMVTAVGRVRLQPARTKRSTPRPLNSAFHMQKDRPQEKQLLLISPKSAAWWGRLPAVSPDPLLAELKTVLATGRKHQASGTLQTLVQDTFVQHLIGLREDPIIPREVKLRLDDGSERVVTTPELRTLLNAVNNSMANRLYGIQAYPALARVVKLAIDVEIDLAVLPAKWHPRAETEPGEGAVFFGLSATLGDGTNPDRLWTACRLTEKSFVAASREELELDAAVHKNGPTGPLKDLLPKVDPPTFQGVWNLGATLQDSPRFMITSLDVVSRAGQLLNTSQSTARSSQTSMGLPDEGDYAPARTKGLTIIDSARGADVQRTAAAAIKIRATTGTDRRLLFADDVTVGYHLDVGVAPAAGQALEWRRLMQRTLVFGKTADGKIDIQALVNATLSAAAPESEAAAAALGSRLAEASFRAASRIVSSKTLDAHDKFTDAEIIAQQHVVEWLVDPLGAPCGEEMHTAVQDGLTDLLLDVTVDLPKGNESKKTLPPMLRIGRPYWFAARAIYCGGAGPSLADAEAIYRRGRGGRLTLPHNVSPGEVFRRQERIAAPKVAVLYRNGDALRDPRGETLEKLILRTREREGVETDRMQRLLYVSGVPQEFAAVHPDPHDRGHNALDHAPIVHDMATDENRPLGGLINVDIDPAIGGLRIQKSDGSIGDAQRIPDGIRKPRPVNTKPDEGVFRIRPTSAKELAARQSPYYPDPFANALVLELWTTEGAPRCIAGPIMVPILDEDYRQAVDSAITGTDSVACLYPFAMPVLLDLHAAAWNEGTELSFESRHDTGTLDPHGWFSRLAPKTDPPDGSVTVRRVTARVRAGETLQLKTWSHTSPERMDCFAAFHEASNLLLKLNAAEGGELSQTVHATLGLQLPRFAGDDAAQKTQLIRHLADLVSSSAHPEQAEILKLDLLHAVQLPRSPAWICGANLCHEDQERNGHARLTVLRRAAGDVAAWRTWLDDPKYNHKDIATWETLNASAATTVTFGGCLAVDVAAAEAVQLEVRCRDFRDEGGKPLPYHDGYFDFPYIGLLTCSAPLLGQDRRPLTFAKEKLGLFDLVTSPGGEPRDLTIHLPDPRAYKLEVTPTTGSRYIKYLDRKPESASRSAYASRGDMVEIWAPATVRPSPMGHVSLLPVFIWEEHLGGGERRTRMRLSWQRPRRRPAITPSGRSPNAGWFSSGEGELLGIVFAPAAPETTKIGKVAAYLSQWGGDAIRTGTPPLKGGLRGAISVPANDDGSRRDSWAMGQWMPFPGDSDREPAFIHTGSKVQTADMATRVDLLTLEPEYDLERDLWYSDIDINAARVAGPWVRLGLVRYQPNAISDGTANGDMHVSEPTRVEFRLEPTRIVEVVTERHDEVNDVWPVRITVRGSNSVVAGGRRRQSTPEENVALEALSRPRFKLAILRRPYLLLDGFDQPGGDITIAEQTSDGSPPPFGDILWTTTINLEHNPELFTQYAYLEEVDAMLPANSERYPKGHLVESGPRFMAKVRIRRSS